MSARKFDALVAGLFGRETSVWARMVNETEETGGSHWRPTVTQKPIEQQTVMVREMFGVRS